MDSKRFLLVVFVALIAILVQNQSAPMNAQAQTPPALSGQITSAEEGSMEGVVVSAKRDGSTISVSVVTNAQGRFAFPAARLEPGHYTLKARAAGYELDGARAAGFVLGDLAGLAAGGGASPPLSTLWRADRTAALRQRQGALHGAAGGGRG